MKKSSKILIILWGLLLFSNSEKVYAQSETMSSPFLKKGVVFFGLTGGASLRESENENALVVTIQEQQKRGYNILMAGGYMLKPNFAVGGAFRYDESRLSKNTIDSDGIKSFIREAGSINSTSVFLKNFIPITPNQRINLYNIVGLAWVADRKTSENTTQDILTRTFTNKNTIQLGISPGIQVFVVEGFATEVGVNVAGFSASSQEVTINGEPGSSVNTFDVDLKLDILSLNISFYYYFPLKK